MSVHALFRGGAAQSAAAAATRSGPLVAAFFAPFAGRGGAAAAAVPLSRSTLRAAQVVLAEADIAGDGGEGLETLAVEHFAVQHLIIAGLGVVVVVEGVRSAVPHPVVPAGPRASGGGRRNMATAVANAGWAAPTAAAWDNIVECSAWLR